MEPGTIINRQIQRLTTASFPATKSIAMAASVVALVVLDMVKVVTFPRQCWGFAVEEEPPQVVIAL